MELSLTWKPELGSATHPLYVSIIKALADDIERGELAHGTRLPTQRELADALGVALGTVTKAYGEAERRGLIHSQGRRGTFVGIEGTRNSPLSELMDIDDQTIDLSKNHPTYHDDRLVLPLKSEHRGRIKGRAARPVPSPRPSAGLPRHREAGARWFESLGWAVNPENVLVTAGGQHAMMVILAAVAAPGEVVLASEYTYPGLKTVAAMLGVELVGVAIDSDGPLPESIRTICRQRKVRALYCNPTLHNPTGYIMSERRRRAVADREDRLRRPARHHDALG